MAATAGKVSQIIGPVVDVTFSEQALNYLKFTIH